MKKIIASAVGLVLVGGVAVTTASAVESQFGGYWRTRAFFQSDFVQDGSGDGSDSYNRTDTRTRLFYTAKFNDDFKFVNAFEFNANYGDTNGGDIGTDGDTFKVKHSYADFTLGNVNTKLGLQGVVISRGFIFDDDFAGAVVTADFGGVKVPFVYISGPQDDVNDNVDNDTHIFSLMPSFNVNDSIALTPHFTYATQTEDNDSELYYIGIDADMKFDTVSAWATFIYNGGDNDNGPGVDSSDIEAFLVGAGADAGIVHGQAFYASGDDDANDDEIDSFISPDGSSYYWSEIMGLGVFDNTAPAAIPGGGGDITDIWAANLGVTLKPMDKLKFDFDVWYASLAEENINGDDTLGLEFDAKLTYALMDNLNAEFIFAYLVADDAIGDDDVMEGGVRVSLKF